MVLSIEVLTARLSKPEGVAKPFREICSMREVFRIEQNTGIFHCVRDDGVKEL
jgi:hypothetical protein